MATIYPCLGCNAGHHETNCATQHITEALGELLGARQEIDRLKSIQVGLAAKRREDLANIVGLNDALVEARMESNLAAASVADVELKLKEAHDLIRELIGYLDDAQCLACGDWIENAESKVVVRNAKRLVDGYFISKEGH